MAYKIGSSFNPFLTATFVDDFACGSTNNAGALNWKITNNWTNSALFDQNHPGVMSLDVSNGDKTELGLCASTSTYLMTAGGGEVDIYWVCKLSNLSDGTDRFTATIGYGIDFFPGNGIWFSYTDNANSGKWVISCSKSDVQTDTNTTVAADTNWHTFHINLNAAGTLATYYIDGVSVGTNNTNLPTNLAPGCNIVKQLGTAARHLYVDLFYMFYQMTSSRS